MKILLLALVVAFAEARDSGKWTGTMETPGDLDHLTADVATRLKDASISAGWYTADQRYAWPIYESESATYYATFTNQMDEVKTFAAEIIAPDTMENIRAMFYYMAWYTANSKVGYFNDANNDIAQVDYYRGLIIASGDMTEDLVDSLKWMSHDAGWYAQNSRWLWPGASDDYDKMEANYQLIVGDFILQDVIFNQDGGHLYGTTEKVVGGQDLPNDSGFTQHMKIGYTVMQGTTKSTTHDLAFGLQIGASLDVRLFFITVGLNGHFKLDAGASWTNSMHEGEVYSYEYDLYVPANSHYKSEATIIEGQATMDYEIVFTVNGKYHSIHGLWEGTAVDESHYHVCEVDVNC